MLLAKLQEYKSDLKNLKNEVKKFSSGNSNQASRDELLESGMADTMAVSSEQRARLMILTGRLNQTTDRVRDSRRTMLETRARVSILQDLHGQRQALLGAHNTAVEVTSEVNSWAEKETNGLIKDVLPLGSVVQTTRLIFANTLYFKGSWTEQFDALKTKEDDFHLLEGNPVKVLCWSSDIGASTWMLGR